MVLKTTRTIRFYAIDWITDTNAHVSKSENFLRNILTGTHEIPYGDKEHLIIKEYPDYPLHNKENIESCWVMSRIRQVDLPQISDTKAEHIESLSLRDDQGLRDPGHFILFDNGAIIGAESNRQCRNIPSVLQGLLSRWIISNPDSGLIDVNINAIQKKTVNPDDFSELRKICVRSSWNYMKNLVSTDKRLADIYNINDEMQLEFSLIGDKKQNKGRIINGLDFFRDIMRKPESINEFTMFKIEGVRKNKDGKYEEVNVLNDLMVLKKPVVNLDELTKGVDPSSMYEKIIEAYKECSNDIYAYRPSIRQ